MTQTLSQVTIKVREKVETLGFWFCSKVQQGRVLGGLVEAKVWITPAQTTVWFCSVQQLTSREAADDAHFDSACSPESVTRAASGARSGVCCCVSGSASDPPL